MLRRLQAFLALGVSIVAVPAAAQEPTDNPAEKPASENQQPAQTGTEPAAAAAEPTEKPSAEGQASAEGSVGPKSTAPSLAASTTGKTAEAAEADEGAEGAEGADAAEAKPAKSPGGWDMGAKGYFRVPMAIGNSRRPNPDDLDGPARTQWSYGPNRTVDANYYSFAYTRLQEQDWVELFVTAKKKHVEAAVGWMGYWYQSAAFRNPDASWAPGMAYLTLDTDVEVAGIKPNVALTMGAWWPKFGTFDKYDTYTLGRFRQLGEQLRLTVPLDSDFTVTVVQGFGTNRDGSFSILAPAPYQATVGLDLLHYENIQLTYKKYVDLGLHYNSQWTRDPNLTPQTTPGKAFTEATAANLATIGGELTLRAPYAGKLWVSPSYVTIRNGWALAKGGIEIMHSLGAEGLATNYLSWTNDTPTSTGSGTMFNLGFLYENTLSNVLGEEEGSQMPEVTLSAFGLMMNANLDLPEGSTLTVDKLKQLKYGADVTVQALDWLSFMLRYDQVNYDLDQPGYIFSAITPRVTLCRPTTSRVRASTYSTRGTPTVTGWYSPADGPQGAPLVVGSDILQSGPYAGEKPDMDIIKLQASVAF